MSSNYKHKEYRDKMKKKTQKKWENKRKKWYNQTVWKGWSESGESSKVTVYNIKDLDKDKQ